MSRLKEPPQRYRVRITVSAMDNAAVELDLNLEDIERSDILAPDYKVPVVRQLVKHFEYYNGFSDVNPEDEAQ